MRGQSPHSSRESEKERGSRFGFKNIKIALSSGVVEQFLTTTSVAESPFRDLPHIKGDDIDENGQGITWEQGKHLSCCHRGLDKLEKADHYSVEGVTCTQEFQLILG